MRKAWQSLEYSGYDKFYYFFTDYFDTSENVLDNQNLDFIREVKATQEFKLLNAQLKDRDPSKLSKLALELMTYFQNPETSEDSQVIVFVHHRAVVDRIKKYLDNKTDGIVKAERFVGQRHDGTNNGMSQKEQRNVTK